MGSMQKFQDSFEIGMKQAMPFVDNLGGGIVAPESLVHIDPVIYEKNTHHWLY